MSKRFAVVKHFKLTIITQAEETKLKSNTFLPTIAEIWQWNDVFEPYVVKESQ